MYETTTPHFTGPLDKLLALIEERSLDISQVSLAAVTDDFLGYLKRSEAAIEPGMLADFLVIASRLVLIKSKALIPELPLTEEEKHDIGDLEARLAIYREFASRNGVASGHVRDRWNGREEAFSRTLFQTSQGAAGFFPPKTLTAAMLAQSLTQLAAVLERTVTPVHTITRAVISIEEKITEIVERVARTAGGRFSDLAKSRPREEVVALFLALLHLLRNQRLAAEQNGTFGDILFSASEEKRG